MISKVENFPLTLIDVKATPVVKLNVEFNFSDPEKDYNITLERNVRYRVVFLQEGNISQVIGKVAGVYKRYSPSTQMSKNTQMTAEWIIRIDASTEDNALIVDIPSTQIRQLERYRKYIGESINLTNATTHGGITYGKLENVTLKDIVRDSNGFITGGTIVTGVVSTETDETKALKTFTQGGCSIGTNNKGHQLLVEGARTIGGNISGGQLVQGAIIVGLDDQTNGMATGCTINGAVVIDAAITNASTSDGTLLDQEFEDCMVYDGTRVGNDMMTVGGATIGEVTTGGQTSGGTVTGGIAIGWQNGKLYVIYGCTGEGGLSTGGTLFGGEVLSGEHVGGGIFNSKVQGGTLQNGMEVGVKCGIGTDGYVIPASHYSDPTELKAALIAGVTIIEGADRYVPGDAWDPNKSNNHRDWLDGGLHDPYDIGHGAYTVNPKDNTHRGTRYDGLIVWNADRAGVGTNLKNLWAHKLQTPFDMT